ncbi:hypothetical protein P7C71_g5386, partial [Lecanoromycetidae sp. Uapishka_2]
MLLIAAYIPPEDVASAINTKADTCKYYVREYSSLYCGVILVAVVFFIVWSHIRIRFPFDRLAIPDTTEVGVVTREDVEREQEERSQDQIRREEERATNRRRKRRDLTRSLDEVRPGLMQ